MLTGLLSKLTGDTYKRNYHIGKKIFSAAFSDIYEATDRRTGRLLILKILNEPGEQVARKHLQEEDTMWEGELLFTLQHPNIVKGLDCDSGRKFWIAMEYLDTTLNHFISRQSGRYYEETELIEIFYGNANAIDYLHKRNLVHRDIAPDNIMLKGNEAKLIDFGMTIPVGSNAVRGRVGTPSYMAPEMIRKTESTPSIDIYSFGVVMYEVVTGIKLFSGRLKEERMTRVLNVHPLSPRELDHTCSDELERLIMRCVSKQVRERPVNAQEVVEILAGMRK